MKKSLLCVIILLVWCGHVFGFAGGDGSPGDPWQVEDAHHLNAVRNNLAAHYIQIDHIDLTDAAYLGVYANWVPIAGNDVSAVPGDWVVRFTGSYNGQGYLIENLNIDPDGRYNVGLFGHVGQGARITNVRLDGVTVTGARGVGSLIGRVSGNFQTLIERCSAVDGTVVGDGATGGLVGSNNSVTETPGGTNNPIISQCFADIEVNYSGSGAGDKFGGLTGCSQKGTIIDSYARGAVDVSSPAAVERVGGLAGCIELRGLVQRSYSTGAVSVGIDTDLVGGLVGNVLSSGAGNNGLVTASYWDTGTSLQPTSAAGEPRNTGQMTYPTDVNTFVGWDFDDIWAIDDDTVENPIDRFNNGYPYLQWQLGPLAIVLVSFSAAFSDGCMAVEWETATEIDTIGFYLWRSGESGNGFVRIVESYTNSKALMETMGARYSYIDCDVDLSGADNYHYKLEELEAGDTVKSIFYGPIGPVSARTLSTSAERIPGKRDDGGSSGFCFIRTLMD